MMTCECCRRAPAAYRISFPMAAFKVCPECAADTMSYDPDIDRPRPEPLSLWAL
jgi:ribosome-binding protein aMBF1 (putative translation factor)